MADGEVRRSALKGAGEDGKEKSKRKLTLVNPLEALRGDGGTQVTVKGGEPSTKESTPMLKRNRTMKKKRPNHADYIFRDDDAMQPHANLQDAGAEEDEAETIGDLFEHFYELEKVEDEIGEQVEEQDMINALKQKKSNNQKTTDLERVVLFITGQRENLLQGSHEVPDWKIEEDAKFGPYVQQDEYSLLREELHEQSGIRSWFIFDMTFGVLVVANGILLGLQTEGTIDPEASMWKAVEYCFFFAFLFEFTVRAAHAIYKKRAKKLLTDPWTLIDLFCLSISAVDHLMDFIVTSQSAGLTLISVMRVVRLLRLIRLVRLFNLFQELWILVSGLFHSISVLFWSIMMMLLFCYIFGVGLFEALGDFHPEPLPPESDYHWGSVPKCILSMAQIATYDGIALARDYTQNLTHPLMLGAFVVFITIVSFAILNLIIGVLLTTTLRSTTRDDGYSNITQRLLKHEAILTLRGVLRAYCEAHDKNTNAEPMLTRVRVNYVCSLTRKPGDETMMQDSSSIAPDFANEDDGLVDTPSTREKLPRHESSKWSDKMVAWHSLESTSSVMDLLDVTALHVKEEQEARTYEDFFSAAGIHDSDVNEVFDELRNVHGKDIPMSVDDFITSILWMKSKPHPLEMVEFMNNLRDMYRRTVRQIQAVTITTQQMEQATKHIQESLADATGKPAGGAPVASDAPHQAGNAAAAAADTRRSEDISAGAMSAQEAELVLQDRLHALEAERWDAFDAVFGMAVLLNVAILGVEASLDQSRTRDITNTKFDSVSFIWFIVEVFFYAVYCLEAFLRAVFSYQMRELKDFRTWMGRFPKFLWSLDLPGAVRVLRHVPKMLKDPMFVFEVFIIGVATLDNFLLRFLVLQKEMMAVIRILGLMRLLRVGRLVHLVKPLRIIAAGFFVNTRLIFWTMILLMCLIYMAGIAMVDLVGRSSDDPAVRKYWAHLGDAMVTLALMATYNDWAARIEEVGRHYVWAYPLGVLFTVMAGLGILNLVTGVMVQAAFAIISSESKDQASLALNDLRVEFHHAVQRVFKDRMTKAHRMRQRIQEHTMARFDDLKRHQAPAAHSKKTHGKNAEQMATSSSIEPTETGGEEEEETKNSAEIEEAPVCVSTFNLKNSCDVLAVLWLSVSEIAVRIRTKADKSDGPQREPRLSCLSWSGGMAKPVMTFEKTVGKCEEVQTIMVFQGIPGGKRLQFRYGGNYSRVDIDPNGSELRVKIAAASGRELDMYMRTGLLEELNRAPFGFGAPENLEDLYEHIGYSELEDVIQDRALNSKLEEVGIRPEHVLLSFGELNITGEERLRTSDLIEGVVRLHRQLVGIDVARSKSVMRRMNAEMNGLYEVAKGCQQTFSQVVEALQTVKLVSFHDPVFGGDPIHHHDAAPGETSEALPAASEGEGADVVQKPATKYPAYISFEMKPHKHKSHLEQHVDANVDHPVDAEAAPEVVEDPAAAEGEVHEVVTMTVEEANDKLRVHVDTIREHLHKRLLQIGLSRDVTMRLLAEASRRPGEHHGGAPAAGEVTPPVASRAEDDDDAWSIESADAYWE